MRAVAHRLSNHGPTVVLPSKQPVPFAVLFRLSDMLEAQNVLQSAYDRQVAGNTAAQAMAIGWLAADIIRSS